MSVIKKTLSFNKSDVKASLRLSKWTSLRDVLPSSNANQQQWPLMSNFEREVHQKYFNCSSEDTLGNKSAYQSKDLLHRIEASVDPDSKERAHDAPGRLRTGSEGPPLPTPAYYNENKGPVKASRGKGTLYQVPYVSSSGVLLQSEDDREPQPKVRLARRHRRPSTKSQVPGPQQDIQCSVPEPPEDCVSPALVIKALMPLLQSTKTGGRLGLANDDGCQPAVSANSSETGSGSDPLDRIRSPSSAGCYRTSSSKVVVRKAWSQATLNVRRMTTEEFEAKYEVVQKIGEGWFSRIHLTEHRQTRQEVVFKSIKVGSTSHRGVKSSCKDPVQPHGDPLWEFRVLRLLSHHPSIVTVYEDLVFHLDNPVSDTSSWVFGMEYAHMGDLTSNLGESGIGEACAKKVAKQVGSGLDWVHSKGLCHLDVRLDNILVLRSDFSLVKLCDFGCARARGQLVAKDPPTSALYPHYTPPELAAEAEAAATGWYTVDWSHDAFQFGIVVFYCLVGSLPWQRADPATDPGFAHFCRWVPQQGWVSVATSPSSPSSKSVPRSFRSLTTKGHKVFKKLLEVDPVKRRGFIGGDGQLARVAEDPKKWLITKKGPSKGQGSMAFNLTTAIASAVANAINPHGSSTPSAASPTGRQGSPSKPVRGRQGSQGPIEAVRLGGGEQRFRGSGGCEVLPDGVSSTLTFGSFKSAHSNLIEKNRVLFTLLQHGVETTVDRSQKNSRIMNWIQHGNPSEASDDIFHVKSKGAADGENASAENPANGAEAPPESAEDDCCSIEAPSEDRWSGHRIM